MASIRDIAKMAGVSAASVSRILNNDLSFSVNENTRRRVIEIANKVNYSKDKSLKANRNSGDEFSIGMIVRHSESAEISDPYFQLIRKGVETEAAKWRIKVSLAFRMRDQNKDWEQLATYGAIIIIGGMTEEALDKVSQYNKNIILVDNYKSYSAYDSIHTDFEQKTHEILDVLYKKGHKRIAYIGGESSQINVEGHAVISDDEVRGENYKKWMKLNNLEKYIQIFQSKWSVESGMQLGKKMLSQDTIPTAVLIGSDPMALGVYRAINDAGLSIPEDISIVSFDDNETSQYLSPALSSVKVNSEEMGRLAVIMAKDRMLDNRKMAVTVICSTELMLRESIGSVII